MAMLPVGERGGGGDSSAARCAELRKRPFKVVGTLGAACVGAACVVGAGATVDWRTDIERARVATENALVDSETWARRPRAS